MTEPAVKRELRERFLALRRAIAPAERREKDAAICRKNRICSACGEKNVFFCPVTGRT